MGPEGEGDIWDQMNPLWSTVSPVYADQQQDPQPWQVCSPFRGRGCVVAWDWAM